MCGEGLIEKFPQLDSCCCCCKVETGSKVIGWIEAIAAFLYTITTIIGLVGIIVGGFSSDKPEVHRAALIAAIFFTSIMVIVLIFMWGMAIILLIGLYKDDLGKLRLWLKTSIFLFFFGIVMNVLRVITIIVASQTTAAEIIGLVAALILQTLIALYIIAVVKSHYNNKTSGFEQVQP